MNKKGFTPLDSKPRGIIDIQQGKHLTGFTFLEVIASTLIIAVLSAGMFSAFVGAQYIFNRSRHRMQAFNFAREAQDKLRSNYTYTDSQMNEGSGHTESELGTIITGEMSNLNTVLTYDISEPEDDTYKEVTLRVTWNEANL
jgi:type II secretory pathway pseudopilin PulG